MITLVERVETATQKVHAEQERELSFLVTIDSREAYGSVLAAYLGLYAPLEILLAAIDWSGFPEPGPLKATVIRSDLADLGWNSKRIAAIPDCSQLPAIDGRASAIGVRYVLEGAALGARAIGRRVVDRLGIEPPVALRFLGSYGVDPRRCFRAYTRALAAAELSPAEGQCVIDAALATFASFTSWMGTSRPSQPAAEQTR